MSGLYHFFAKETGVKAPRVRIPLSPPFFGTIVVRY